jgi:hypothetical protein
MSLREKDYNINHKGSHCYAQSTTKEKNKRNILFQQPPGKEIIIIKHVILFEICNFAFMDKIETKEDFYKRKFDWMPDNLKDEIGHFNVFSLELFVGDKAQPVPYKQRDFYKIMLVKGNSQVHYADKVVEVKKQAISFSNPLIPYKWEQLDNIRSGFFCIFNQHFFHQFRNV